MVNIKIFRGCLCGILIFMIGAVSFIRGSNVIAAELEPVTLVDAESRVQVELNASSYEEGRHLIVNKIDMLSSKYNKVYSQFDDNQKHFAKDYKFYDIAVVSGEERKIPAEDLGTVTVRIPIEDSFSEENLKILRLVYGQNNDIVEPGVIVEIEGKRYFSFETNNLSTFAFVDIDTNKTLPVIIWSIIITFLIAGGIVSVFIIKNHKKKL